MKLNTQSNTWWYYTPKESVTRPDDVNNKSVDLGRVALLETANICYGGALMIFAVILLMRVITNTAIPHPRNKIGERGIAYFETSMLAYAFLSTICGMGATALGMEPKTAWAVFSLGVASIIGFAVSYHYETEREKEAEYIPENTTGVAGNIADP